MESTASAATSGESETTPSLEEAAQEIKTEEAPSDDLKSITEDGGGSGEIEVVSKGKADS